MGRSWSVARVADRSWSSADPSIAAEPADPNRPERTALTPHCWVTAAPEHPGRHAGLLLEWRREGTGWLGLVTYVVPEERHERVRLIQQWLPATCLSPADTPAAR
jgi:hypothetical protein